MGSLFEVLSPGVRSFSFAWLAPAAVLALAGCLVDPGPDTGPPAGCNAPAPFFVSDMWPKYFGPSAPAYNCGKSDCHDASSGHGFFRLTNVSMVTAPMPTDPVSTWPMEWSNNLVAVQHNVSCSNPTESLVLIVPEGRGQPHPPGVTVTDPATADALFQMWLK
jgi:hypothetical protein